MNSPESIFCLGFLVGAVFTSSGLLGFSTGCLLGIMATDFYNNRKPETIPDIEKPTSIYSYTINIIKDKLLSRQ